MAPRYILFPTYVPRSYTSQNPSEEKTWVDKMSDAVGCIALDDLGATIAIGHGEKVSVIDQTTICMYCPILFKILTAELPQLYGGISGFSQTHPRSITSRKNCLLLRPVLYTSCVKWTPCWFRILNTASCKTRFTRSLAFS